MNRPIEFRGKCIKSGNMVYGDLIHGVGIKKGKIYILPDKENLAYVKHCDPLDGVEVIPETVGQLVYIDHRSEQKYYEGDKDKDGDVLMYNKELGLFAMHSYYSVFNKWSPSSYPIDFSRVKIIGTIHD